MVIGERLSRGRLRSRILKEAYREAQHVAAARLHDVDERAEVGVDVVLQRVDVEARAEVGEARDVDKEKSGVKFPSARARNLFGRALRPDGPEPREWEEGDSDGERGGSEISRTTARA